MINVKVTYPELYYSARVSSIFQEKPLLPNKPEAPVRPKKPDKPKESIDGGNRGCSIVIFILSIIGFIFVVSSDKVGLQGILLSLALIVLSYLLFKTTTWDKEATEREKEQYKEAIKKYPQELERYEVMRQDYEAQLAEYNNRIDKLLSAENLRTLHMQKIRTYLEERLIPTFMDCDSSDTIKKGASEDFFVSLLRKFAGTEWDIYVNKKIPVKDSFYYPDIIIVNNNIYVDVEIDEPYAGNDGTPIHYINLLYGMDQSVDKDRNEFMTKHGWEVVRFSEEQIFKYPERCLDVIFYVMNNLWWGDTFDKNELEESFICEKWTKDQAAKMAYKRFRRTYVPLKYRSNIDNEDYRSYDELKKEIFSSDKNQNNEAD